MNTSGHGRSVLLVTGALSLVLPSACFDAHDVRRDFDPDGGVDISDGPTAGDGGGAGTQAWSVWDAAYDGTPVPDLRAEPSAEDLAQCGEVAGFQRCDSCPDRCPPGSSCVEDLGICKARLPSGVGDGCYFELSGDVPSSLREVPLTGLPCAVSGTSGGVPEGRFRGNAMPSEYCVAAASLDDLPPQRCVYPDGTPLVSGPPPTPCPGDVGLVRVCGGTCGEPRCVSTVGADHSLHISPCVGLSDDRGFGLCAFRRRRCGQSNAADLIPGCSKAVSAWWSGFRPCACLVSVERPDEAPEPLGFVVPAEACLQYRSWFPESVECRDADWMPIP